MIYINTLSNHTPLLIKHLSTLANEKLSKNLSNEEIFTKSKVDYQKVLKESGFQSTKLAYKNRRRNILWFNPPFNKNVSTNAAKRFLNLMDKQFLKDNKLHKFFNGNSVKVIYSCTGNIKLVITTHNKKLLSVNIKQYRHATPESAANVH